MKFFKRLLLKTFWYELHQNLTIWMQLKKNSDFNSIEINKIKESYITIKKDNKHLIKDSQSEFHISWCSLILAIYNMCIEKNIEKNKAIDITESIMFLNMRADSLAKYTEIALDKENDPFNYLVNSSKWQEEKFFGETFSFHRKIDNDKSYYLRVNKCMYFEFFKINKAPELMRLVCKWDMVSWSLGIIPDKHKVLFERPVTLGLDGKDCKFNFDRQY